MKAIEVENLTKKFGELIAVNNISFEVEEGVMFGFLGPNGAGKTTTINMLCTLLEPTEGWALLNGHDVSKESHLVRQSIGLVFQDPSLDDRLTGYENLDFHAMIYGLSRSVRGERIEGVLEMVELYDRRDDEVRTYSGGMKRRLEIARGLLHYPKVLFLDEPTLGLDPQTRLHIWDYINLLRERENITIFLTTHYMVEAENCDYISIIDYGRIIAEGSPRDLKLGMGGDLVTLKTEDDEKAAKEIKERLEIEPELDREGLRLKVKDGPKFVPLLVTTLSVPVYSIETHEPTLEDVFLSMTGRQIREEAGDPNDALRAFIRRH